MKNCESFSTAFDNEDIVSVNREANDDESSQPETFRFPVNRQSVRYEVIRLTYPQLIASSILRRVIELNNEAHFAVTILQRFDDEFETEVGSRDAMFICYDFGIKSTIPLSIPGYNDVFQVMLWIPDNIKEQYIFHNRVSDLPRIESDADLEHKTGQYEGLETCIGASSDRYMCKSRTWWKRVCAKLKASRPFTLSGRSIGGRGVAMALQILPWRSRWLLKHSQCNDVMGCDIGPKFPLSTHPNFLG